MTGLGDGATNTAEIAKKKRKKKKKKKSAVVNDTVDSKTASPLFNTDRIFRRDSKMDMEENIEQKTSLPASSKDISSLPIVDLPRFDFYQTRDSLTVSFYVKGLSQENVKVHFTDAEVKTIS